AMIASNLGVVAMELGNLEHAREALTRTLDLQRQMGDKRSIPYTLTNLGEVWFRSNDFVIAGELYTEAMALFHELGELRCEAMTVTSMARMALTKGEYADALRMVVESNQTLTSVDDATSGVENIELLANLAVRCRAFEDAAELFGAAESIRRAIDAPARGSLQSETDEARSATQRAMDQDAFAVAFQRGQDLDFRAASERIPIIAAHLIATTRDLEPIPPLVRCADTQLESEYSHLHLTARERDVLRLLAEGETTRQIAASLFISPRTASTHVTNILSKLGVTSRTAAVAYALRIGLV
ncbi:MAG: LuxR C-terminal-related transcriptional regulator, partial [Thermomicrobiales bacterium]